MNSEPIRAAMQRAVDLFGSEKALAAACDVTQTAINKAKRLSRVSPELAMAIQRATGGAVPGSDLRPDLWRKPADVPIERLNGRRKRA